MSETKDSDLETSKDSCFFEESSSSTVMTNPPGDEKHLITKEMEAEEKRMADENKKEEERIKKQYEEELKTQEKLEKEAKYKRLMHLLNQSQFYTNFLMKKIETSKKEEAKREEAKKRAEEKKNSLESRSLKEVNNADNSPRTHPKKEQGAKNSRKRSKITDYIDHETINNVKKRRTDSDEILKKPEPVPAPVAGVRINSMGLEVPENQPMLFEGGVLRQYQLQGLEWMKALFENGVNGILADEMGLGKTIQVIALLCHLIEQGIRGPYLIVAPLSTLPNWVMEFERFAPQLPVVLFHGSKYDRPKLYKKLRTKVKVNEKISIAPVVLTSYQVPRMENKFMSTFNWRYIIVDEGHALKNANAQLTRCLKSFKSVNRLLLTGTPLQNNLKELWALLNFLLPEVFDDLVMFQALFDIEAVTSSETGNSILQKEAESHILATLHQILTPFLLRRVKTDVELNLPTKKEVLVHCPMTELQLRLYKATIDKVIETLLKTGKEDEVAKEDLNAPRKKRKCAEKRKDYTFKDFDWLGENTPPVEEEKPESQEIVVDPGVYTNIKMACPEMQLRKIANHPYLVQMPTEMVAGDRVMKSSEEVVTVSGKMLALSAMLLKLKQRGHKVLIFSYFKIMLNLIEEFALMRGYPYVRLDGNDDIEERKKNIKAFNSDPDMFLFLITTRAGGLGLNLTSADTVIIFDSDYNPQVDLQAMDRCHRIGQKKPVIVYRFISRGTVDEKIHKVATGKRKLEKVVIKRGAFKLSGQTKKVIDDLEELKQLLDSADHHKEVQSNGLVFTDEELEELLDRTVEDSKNEGNHFKVVGSGTSQ